MSDPYDKLAEAKASLIDRELLTKITAPAATLQELIRKIHPKAEDAMLYGELYNARPGCDHKVVSASGGGIKCVYCPGWFCY